VLCALSLVTKMDRLTVPLGQSLITKKAQLGRGQADKKGLAKVSLSAPPLH